MFYSTLPAAAFALTHFITTCEVFLGLNRAE